MKYIIRFCTLSSYEFERTRKRIFKFCHHSFLYHLIFFLLYIFYLSLSNCYCQNNTTSSDILIKRFFPTEDHQSNFIKSKYPNMPLPQLSDPLPTNIGPNNLSVAEYNYYVDLNNKGVESSKNNDFALAVKYYKEALKINPAAKDTWLNLLSALYKQKSNHQEIINTALIIINLFKDDTFSPIIGALTAYYELKQPDLSIAFLQEQLRRNPDDKDAIYLYSLILYEKNYLDHAYELVSKFISEHSLENVKLALIAGHILAKKEKYIELVKLLKGFLPFDEDGKLHDLYIRSRFYAGDLLNLENEILSAHRKFPNIPNKKIHENFLFRLKEREYEVTRSIIIHLPTPQNYNDIEVTFSIPLQIPDYQYVDIKNIIIDNSPYKTYSLPVSEIQRSSKPNILVVKLTQPYSNKIRVSAITNVRIKPYFAQKGYYNMEPPKLAEEIRKMSDVNFDDANLNILYNHLANQPGNFMQNAVLCIYNGLKYNRNYIDYDISWIFQNLDKCDCTEYALLLFALCIKRGLPARMVSGLLFEDNINGKEISVGHVWCEVYFKNKGWVPIDVTNFSIYKWATFGHMLSDTIVFDYFYNTQEKKYSLSYLSSSKDENANLENFYKIKLIR